MAVTENATLAGHRATSARVTIPAWGAWYANAVVDGDVELSGSVELVVADLRLRGTVIGGGPSSPKSGRSRFRIVGGAGGWGRTIDRKAYANDAEVKLATVLTDAARACGETIDASTIPAVRIGPAFVRGDGRASLVLEATRPQGWHVGEDGVTRIGLRASKTFGGVATRVTSDRAAASITLASSSLAALVPGAVVDGVEAVDVEHELTAEGLRTTILGVPGGGSGDRARVRNQIAKLVDAADPLRRYRGVFEYSVVAPVGKRLDLYPVRVASGMPALERVPVRGGIPGIDFEMLPGARVLVEFLDALPTRPVVTAFEDPEGGGFLPITMHIAAQTIVRLGLGVRPVIGAGDLAGGLFPVVPTQVVVLV